jgi:hypothetical protein
VSTVQATGESAHLSTCAAHSHLCTIAPLLDQSKPCQCLSPPKPVCGKHVPAIQAPVPLPPWNPSMLKAVTAIFILFFLRAVLFVAGPRGSLNYTLTRRAPPREDGCRLSLCYHHRKNSSLSSKFIVSVPTPGSFPWFIKVL